MCRIILSLVLGFPLTLLAGSQGDSTIGGYPVVKPAGDEVCVVCGTPLSGDDVVLIVKGRRVPLKKEMVDQFLNDPERYFAALQPRGALFQENGTEQGDGDTGEVSPFWFWSGLYLLVALLSAGLSGYVAVSRGLSPISHFFIGLAFSLPGFLYVVTRHSKVQEGEIPKGLSKVSSTSSPATCPQCGAANHPASRTCNSCGASLTPSRQSDVERIS